jgi:hypothetical protein
MHTQINRRFPVKTSCLIFGIAISLCLEAKMDFRTEQKPAFPIAIALAILIPILLLAAFLIWLAPSSRHPQNLFHPAPATLTLRTLGKATNYLKFDTSRAWKAFAISNGTPKSLFYMATEIEYRTPAGWRSAGSWASASISRTSLATHYEPPLELSPGASAVYYASVAPTNLPWRLHVGCFEHSWYDSLDFNLGKIGATLRGRTSSNSKSWSGRRYELISDEIPP